MSRPAIKETWRCPRCGYVLKLFVRASQPPTCANPDEHSSAIVEMVNETPDAES